MELDARTGRLRFLEKKVPDGNFRKMDGGHSEWKEVVFRGLPAPQTPVEGDPHFPKKHVLITVLSSPQQQPS